MRFWTATILGFVWLGAYWFSNDTTHIVIANIWIIGSYILGQMKEDK